MKHKDKVKLAKHLSGKQKKHFLSDEWETHTESIARKVKAKEAKTKERKMKILDDKGKEHKVGEIFESDTLTLEF